LSGRDFGGGIVAENDIVEDIVEDVDGDVGGVEVDTLVFVLRQELTFDTGSTSTQPVNS
jgi:hypothetical protein